MKKTILTAFAVACLATSAMAQQKKPVDNGNALEAQVNVSRDQLKILSEQIGKNATQTYVHADYHAKMEKFALIVNETMTAFDNYLANELLPYLQDDINNYNAVVQSKDYNSQQKEQTLTITMKLIQKKISVVTPKYQEQVLKLYQIFADLPVATGSNGYFTEATTIGGARIDSRNLFQEYVVPLLAEGCRSYSCVTMTSVDYRSLLQGINTKLDRDLSIKLANGVMITIKSAAFNVDETIKYLSSTEYPDEILILPFDAK